MPCLGCRRRRLKRPKRVESQLYGQMRRARSRYEGDISRFQDDDELDPSGDDQESPTRRPRGPGLLRERGRGPGLLKQRGLGPGLLKERGSGHVTDTRRAYRQYAENVARFGTFGSDLTRFAAAGPIAGEDPLDRGLRAVSRFSRWR
jgi:hypothetical protein